MFLCCLQRVDKKILKISFIFVASKKNWSRRCRTFRTELRTHFRTFFLITRKVMIKLINTIVNTLLICLALTSVSALYEDQIGKFDW